MKEQIINKIDTAIKRLRNAKMWVREQGEQEESLMGLVEDNLNEASEIIDGVFTDLDLYEQSLLNQSK